MISMRLIRIYLLLSLLLVELFRAGLAVATETREGAIHYTVQGGDHLYSIARRFGSSVAAIQMANGLTSSLIYPGQPLLIPRGSTRSHLVQRGENLTRVALTYGTTVAAIQQANGLTSAMIYAGQMLLLPGHTVDATWSTSAGSKSSTSTTATERVSSGGTLERQGYTVQLGDTLFRISLKFGTTVGAIQADNGLFSTLIVPGQRLIIPGVVVQPQTSPASATQVNFELGGQVTEHSFGSAVTRMKDAGMTWVKQQLSWEPSDVARNHAYRIRQAHAHGFSVLFSVPGRPEHARDAYFPEYAAFVGELASLGADAIEVWNEPNLPREWEAERINPASYTSLLRQAYRAIKAANYDTLVISGAPSPTGAYNGCGPQGCDDLAFVRGMVSAGALRHMDCLGMHYQEGLVSPTVSNGDPRANSGHYTRYYQTMVDTYWAAISGARPLCLTGLGFLSGEEWGYLPEHYLWDPPYNITAEQHARYLAEAVRLSREQGKVRLSIVFNVNVSGFSDDPMSGYSIIRPNGQCPACATLGAVMRE